MPRPYGPDSAGDWISPAKSGLCSCRSARWNTTLQKVVRTPILNRDFYAHPHHKSESFCLAQWASNRKLKCTFGNVSQCPQKSFNATAPQRLRGYRSKVCWGRRLRRLIGANAPPCRTGCRSRHWCPGNRRIRGVICRVVPCSECRVTHAGRTCSCVEG